MGNNTSADVAHLRDSFMCESEKEHNENLTYKLNNGYYTNIISRDTLPRGLFHKLLFSCKKKIQNKVTSHSLRNRYLHDLLTLLNNQNVEVSNTAEFERTETDVKQILAETLIDMVEYEPLKESEMEAIENTLNLVLGSIVDMQGTRIMTRDL